MADAAKLVANFKAQIVVAVESYAAKVPEPLAVDAIECAFAAGMLLLLSAMKAKDGPTLSFQIYAMHTALREVGSERGWVVEANL